MAKRALGIVMWRLVILLSILPYLQGAAPPEHVRRWMSEINESLAKNIIGCPYHLAQYTASPQFKQSIDHKHFEVQALLPNEAFEQFQRQPPALTQVNQLLVDKLHRFGEAYRISSNQSASYLPDHPFQNHSNIYNLYHAAALGPVAAFSDYATIKRAYYFSRIHNVIIYSAGAVGAGCGRYVGVDGCVSRWDPAATCHKKCLAYINRRDKSWLDMWGTSSDVLTQCSCAQKDVTKHAMVFVTTAGWDSTYHHLLVDSLARIAPFLPFLRAYRGVKIHMFDAVRAQEHEEQPMSASAVAAALSMRNRLLALLGINPSRIVTGTVLAQEAVIPKTMFCEHAAMNPIEIRVLATQLLAGAYSHLSSHGHHIATEYKEVFQSRRSFFLQEYEQAHMAAIRLPPEFFTKHPLKVIMIVIQRRCPSVRCWTDLATSHVTKRLAVEFPEHAIHVVQGSMAEDYCFACELFLYSLADVLVGEHGAGLTNAMFMPAGSLLVETAGHLDGRMLPLCGYFSGLAGGLSIHHYIHVYTDSHAHPGERMDAAAMANEAARMYRVLHS